MNRVFISFQTSYNRMTRKRDLLNQRFGRLIVMTESKERKASRVSWLCQCDCGQRKIISSKNLCDGDTRSCGCLRRDVSSTKTWAGRGQVSKDYYSQIRRNAIKRDINFDITMEEMWELFKFQSGFCALSGIKIELSRNSKKKKPTASIDRIDSSIGYTKENIQWLHKDVNIMKNVFEQKKFINLCERVTNNTSIKTKGVFDV